MMLKQILLVGSLAVMGSVTAWAPTSTQAASTTESVSDSEFATQPRVAWEPGDPADSLYRAGNDQLSRGDFRTAARTFARIVERYPKSVYAGDALYWTAFAHYRLGTRTELREALRALDAQRSDYPKAATRGDADALAVRIRGVLAQGGDDAAAQVITERASATPKPCTTRGDDEDDERIAAMNALLQMNAERALPIIKTVLARRDACSESLRRKAVFLASQLRTVETENILLDVIRNDPSREVRSQAVFWMGQVNTDRAAQELEKLLASSTDEELREQAITALMQQNSARGQAAVRAIAADARAPEGLREKAVFWLGQHRSTENAAYLRGLFDRLGGAAGGENGESIRQKILFSLSQMRGEGNDKWLMEIASDPKFSVETRKQAIFSAGQAQISTADLIALYPRLGDRELKGQLIWVLSQKRDTEAADRLMAIAKSDPDREMRKKAIFWLGQMNDPRVKQFLIDIING